MLDEISCAAAVFVADRFVVTGELVVRYERPVPVETPLELEAEIVAQAHPRYAEIAASVREGGTVLARSTGKFFYHARHAQP
jgi:acyl-coenzyme A thioesterase PaaI-like protein